MNEVIDAPAAIETDVATDATNESETDAASPAEARRARTPEQREQRLQRDRERRALLAGKSPATAGEGGAGKKRGRNAAPEHTGPQTQTQRDETFQHALGDSLQAADRARAIRIRESQQRQVEIRKQNERPTSNNHGA